MNLLVAGKVLGSHHLKGEVKVISHIENIDLLVGKKVLLELENSETKLFTVNSAEHFVGNKWVFSFEEIKNKKDAVEIRNAHIKVRRDLVGIAEDEYLVSDLIGLEVYDVKDNEYLGKVIEIFETAAHDVYVVESDKYEIMIPDVDVFIKKIKFDDKKIEVDLIEGMKELKR